MHLNFSLSFDKNTCGLFCNTILCFTSFSLFHSKDRFPFVELFLGWILKYGCPMLLLIAHFKELQHLFCLVIWNRCNFKINIWTSHLLTCCLKATLTTFRCIVVLTSWIFFCHFAGFLLQFLKSVYYQIILSLNHLIKKSRRFFVLMSIDENFVKMLMPYLQTSFPHCPEELHIHDFIGGLAPNPILTEVMNLKFSLFLSWSFPNCTVIKAAVCLMSWRGFSQNTWILFFL